MTQSISGSSQSAWVGIRTMSASDWVMTHTETSPFQDLAGLPLIRRLPSPDRGSKGFECFHLSPSGGVFQGPARLRSKPCWRTLSAHSSHLRRWSRPEQQRARASFEGVRRAGSSFFSYRLSSVHQELSFSGCHQGNRRVGTSDFSTVQKNCIGFECRTANAIVAPGYRALLSVKPGSITSEGDEVACGTRSLTLPVR